MKDRENTMLTAIEKTRPNAIVGSQTCLSDTARATEPVPPTTHSRSSCAAMTASVAIPLREPREEGRASPRELSDADNPTETAIVSKIQPMAFDGRRDATSPPSSPTVRLASKSETSAVEAESIAVLFRYSSTRLVTSMARHRNVTPHASRDAVRGVTNDPWRDLPTRASSGAHPSNLDRETALSPLGSKCERTPPAPSPDRRLPAHRGAGTPPLDQGLPGPLVEPALGPQRDTSGPWTPLSGMRAAETSTSPIRSRVKDLATWSS